MLWPVILVATPWGGLAAGERALGQPERTRAMVMLNTPVHTAPGGPGFSERFVTWGARWIHATGLYRDGVASVVYSGLVAGDVGVVPRTAAAAFDTLTFHQPTQETQESLR